MTYWLDAKWHHDIRHCSDHIWVWQLNMPKNKWDLFFTVFVHVFLLSNILGSYHKYHHKIEILVLLPFYPHKNFTWFLYGYLTPAFQKIHTFFCCLNLHFTLLRLKQVPYICLTYSLTQQKNHACSNVNMTQKLSIQSKCRGVKTIKRKENNLETQNQKTWFHK